MDALLEIFPNLKHYIELIPVCMVGLFSGAAGYYGDGEQEKSGKRAIKSLITSSFLCVMAYSMLTALDSIPYLARVGIAAAIGYFGIERALEIIKKSFETFKSAKG